MNVGCMNVPLAELSEYLVDELSLAHRVVYFHAELAAHLAYLGLVHAREVVAGLLLYGVENGQAAVRSLETDYPPVDFALGLAVDGYAHRLEKLLGERHHPVVVLVLHVEFHAGELGVVVAVHPLVAEVLANLVDALKAANDQPLKI